VPTTPDPPALDSKTYRALLHTPDGDFIIEIAAHEHIWDAANRNGVTLPATCHQGWCLTCAARVQDGTVDQRDSIAFFQQDYDAHYSLLCTAKPCSDLVIRTHCATAMRRHRLRQKLPSPGSYGLLPESKPE
jgi:ferredoxin